MLFGGLASLSPSSRLFPPESPLFTMSAMGASGALVSSVQPGHQMTKLEGSGCPTRHEGATNKAESHGIPHEVLTTLITTLQFVGNAAMILAAISWGRCDRLPHHEADNVLGRRGHVSGWLRLKLEGPGLGP